MATDPGVGLAGVQASREQLIALRHRASAIDLRTRRAAQGVVGGGRQSRLRGRGMEYTESRPYLPGDDIRNIDWRVTARTGRAHTKLFEEERERPVLLVVDLGGSMFFGTRRSFKSVLAVEVASLLAWAVLRVGDRIGAIVTAPASHAELKPAGGPRAVLRVLAALAELSTPPAEAPAPEPRLGRAVERARRVARPGSLCVMVSDLYGLDDDARHHLGRLRAHCDVVAVHVTDPLESEPPPPARYVVSDGHARGVLDTSSSAVRDAYRALFETRWARAHEFLASLAIPVIGVRTGDDAGAALRRGLAARASATVTT
ncbi:MAG: DUF58 domain-containing protein [Chromatiales bacterium]|nr:DUF58 domain-containing protein [Chromatiales bacterium]